MTYPYNPPPFGGADPRFPPAPRQGIPAALGGFPPPDQNLPNWPPPTTAPVTNDGRGMGIAGFVLAFLGPLALVGIVLSIVSVAHGRAARKRNDLAIAGIVIAAINIIIGITFTLIWVNIFRVCGELGPGIHVIGNTTYQCNT